MKYLGNAFSLNMLASLPGAFTATSVAAADVPADTKSVVGHADTARVLTAILVRDIAYNRETLKLAAGDTLFVAQFVGTRLPEGATSLPEGARIDFIRVDVS